MKYKLFSVSTKAIQLPLFFFSLLLISCAQNDHSVSTIPQNPTVKKENVFEFEDNDLLDKLIPTITNEKVGSFFDNHNYSLAKRPYPNEQNPEQMDTIYNYSSTTDTIELYKSLDKERLISFSINNNKNCIGKGIKIGMTSEEVFNRLGRKNETCDKLIIQTDEDVTSTNIMTFLFTNNQLSQIRYTSIAD